MSPRALTMPRARCAANGAAQPLRCYRARHSIASAALRRCMRAGCSEGREASRGVPTTIKKCEGPAVDI